MPQLDVSTFATQIFWLFVTFAALFIIMWKSAVPKISDALEARQKRIDDQLDKAAEVKKEAEAAIEAYETALASARAEAHDAIAATNAKLAEEARARESELSDKLAASLAKSEAVIAQAVDDAIANIREVTVDVTASAVTRLGGDDIDTKAISDAVDTALKARG